MDNGDVAESPPRISKIPHVYAGKDSAEPRALLFADYTPYTYFESIGPSIDTIKCEE